MALQSSGAISLNNVNVELGNSGTASINMGSSAVRDLFDVPSGAISLSDGYGKANFSATDNFAPVLYTGNGANGRAVTGVGFQPDLVWLKERSSNSSHWLFDSVRGATKRVSSNETASESTYSSTLQSFDTDGFTVGTDVATNENGQTYVAWNWKANGSGVTNTNGSITSTVSANAPAGFSIVSYTGTTTTNTNFTVGHGLGQTPDMVIIKNRDWAAGVKAWQTWVSPLGNNALGLEATNSQSSGDFTYSWNQQPNSTTFTVRADTAVSTSNRYRTNGRTDNYIAYAFHSVTGYSKVGSYTGTGSTGNSVTTGFQPRYVLIKRTTGTNAWHIGDTTRDSTNPSTAALWANDSDSEVSNSTQGINFLSTGFQLDNTTNEMNGNGETYIYLAIA